MISALDVRAVIRYVGEETRSAFTHLPLTRTTEPCATCGGEGLVPYDATNPMPRPDCAPEETR